ncbi:hypothetical protein FEP93_04081 [Burkholderia multivorans]|uniref:hypothetical protein n=1 Tax=Burkholderia multivorans TaxID=87883 RepID=UPI00285CC138|nr:hypothetical protein [Burkholderia multivorans]
MTRKQDSVKEIVATLKQAEEGMPIADPDRQSGISKQTYFEVQIDFSRLANQATRVSLRHSTARSRTMPEPALVRIDVGRETRQYSLRLRPKVYERSCTNTRHCPRIRSGSVMPVSGMVHLQPRGGTSSEEATINPNSLEVPCISLRFTRVKPAKSKTKTREALRNRGFLHLEDGHGQVFGAGDRTRTGKPVKAADFRHTASFEADVA